MNFTTCFNTYNAILMEGALGERLKREFQLTFNKHVAMAGLIYDKKGRTALTSLWKEYLTVANTYNLPFLATTPTRRANKDNVDSSIFHPSIIKDNIEFLKQLKTDATVPMFAGGLMGCKGDAYKATKVLSIEEAKSFHFWQADLFARAGADFLYAGIMPAITEAMGMAQAMEETGLPFIISFMIRNNGRLIDGTTIHDAIHMTDSVLTRQPICYMTNCVHPTVLYEALNQEFNKTELVKERFRGIQANTSPLSPEELDGAKDLKASDSTLFAKEMVKLSDIMNIKIYGGCCGTDKTHIEETAKQLTKIESLF